MLVTKEAEILQEIRDSEKRAENLIEKARKEAQDIVGDAEKNSLELLATKKEEIRKLQAKKIMDFRDNANSMKKEKLVEGKKTVKQIKTKAEKNINKAVDFVMEKFEGMI